MALRELESSWQMSSLCWSGERVSHREEDVLPKEASRMDGSSQGKAGRLRGRELTVVRNRNLKPVDEEGEAGELLEPRSPRLWGHGLSTPWSVTWGSLN